MDSLTILKTYCYHILLGFLFLCTSCLSCKSKKNILAITDLRLAKTVLPIYINAADSQFILKQDTVYYGAKYFTGYKFSLFNNGDTAAINSYFNGVEEGLQKKWYINGMLAEERFYINGKKENINKGWWPDGKLKIYYTALNNEYNGEFKEWYATGLLAKQFHYVNGQEEGSERLWWDNGTVRANYVIKKGKKYGLIGLKICVNPYDSIAK